MLSFILIRLVTTQEKSAHQAVHWTPIPALFTKFCARLSVHLYSNGHYRVGASDLCVLSLFSIEPSILLLHSIQLDIRSFLSDSIHMTGNEFIRKLKKLGRKNGVEVRFVTQRGKGSHGTLFYGAAFTVVRNPKDELKKGTLHAMLAQLNLELEDL